jgi:predicted lysophospholipase L1 biosynthesis ABC-type transport system permease subunit
MGASRSWLTRAVHWQATSFTALALALGTLAGSLAGRFVFVTYANNLGVVSDAVLPLLALVGIVATILLLANMAAAIPARRARRLAPAAILRTE